MVSACISVNYVYFEFVALVTTVLFACNLCMSLFSVASVTRLKSLFKRVTVGNPQYASSYWVNCHCRHNIDLFSFFVFFQFCCSNCASFYDTFEVVNHKNWSISYASHFLLHEMGSFVYTSLYNKIYHLHGAYHTFRIWYLFIFPISLYFFKFFPPMQCTLWMHVSLVLWCS